MTVYVDDMYRYPAGRFRRMKMSHMIADTEAEMHAMAGRIGIARRWYQGDHYDICLAKRSLAVEAGAVEVTWRQLGMMNLKRRRIGILGTPVQAEVDVTDLPGTPHSTPRAIVDAIIDAVDATDVPPVEQDPECRCRPEENP